MQDRTINNALLALRKQGGTEGKLAEVLLDMRGVEWSGVVQDRPMRRGQAKNFVLDALRTGPMTTSEIGALIRAYRPDLRQRAATNRAYQALLRLKDRGLVRREGRVWSTFSD
ncbi:hypothetical protein [Pseudooceanicola sp.]|uniref:hypothetical protein n=1 Tax=Pseudooceanicola sp. TaxID=1914328 RepID=UPI002637322A|nr:hypothetical protein [Pseudooceanicola sp.]MDF1857061.1 hypothetical protein [Pseudooceanicola sp.]